MAAARVGCVSVGTGAESEVESSVKYGRGGDTLRSQFLVPCSLRPVVSFLGGRFEIPLLRCGGRRTGLVSGCSGDGGDEC